MRRVLGLVPVRGRFGIGLGSVWCQSDVNPRSLCGSSGECFGEGPGVVLGQVWKVGGCAGTKSSLGYTKLWHLDQ